MTVLYRPYWDLYAGIERWQPILLLPWLLLSATGVTRPSSATSAFSSTGSTIILLLSDTSATSASSATSATSATSASSATSAIAPVPNLQIEMALQLVEICMQTWKTDN